MKHVMLAGCLLLAAALPAPAQVRIDIGINLPAPPPLVVIPGAPVYYAPHAQANVFFYGEQYWVFNAGGWYVGPTWGGPWVVVAPGHVPGPILRVPVHYYRVPPGHWRGWRHDHAPRWEAHYGREWREAAHERHWREREERWEHSGRRGDDRRGDRDDDRPGDRGKHRGQDRGRGQSRN